MLIDRKNFREHRRWALFTVAAGAAATVWYLAEAREAAGWPGGSTLPGLVFGAAGGAIIAFELLLWWRKWVRTWRIGRVQTWMRAHIWLGLLSVPLILYHSGFRLGGPLSTALLAVFLVVIASGIAGLVLQNIIPRRMLEELPAETIHSQIGRVSGQLAEEAEELVRATCGAPAGSRECGGETVAGPAPYRTVGAIRTAGRVQGRVLQTATPRGPVPGSEPLLGFFTETVEPYLRRGARASSRLASRTEAVPLFQSLRTRLPAEAGAAVEVLEGLCEQRRQFDAQARLHAWLHAWLLVHGPLSAALLVLMAAHIWAAMKYW